MNSNRKQKQKGNLQHVHDDSSITGSFSNLGHSSSNLHTFDNDWKPGKITLTGFTVSPLSNSSVEEDKQDLPYGNETLTCIEGFEADPLLTHGTFLNRSSCNELSPLSSTTSSTMFKKDSVPALIHYKKLLPDENSVRNLSTHSDEAAILSEFSHITTDKSISSLGFSSDVTTGSVVGISPKMEVYNNEALVFNLMQSYSSDQMGRLQSTAPVNKFIFQEEPNVPNTLSTHKTKESPVISEYEGRITSNNDVKQSEDALKAGLLLEKPVVADTILFRRKNTPWRPYSKVIQNSGCNLVRKDSWSTPDLDKLDIQINSENVHLSSKYRNRQSSFATKNSEQKAGYRSVHQDLHTLVDQEVDEDEAESIVSPDEHSNVSNVDGDTLRLKLITQKFDSFHRGQLRAISFRYDPSSTDEDSGRRRHSSCDSFEGRDFDTRTNIGHYGEGILEKIKTNSLPVDRTLLTTSDVARIELFFNSQQTQVFSCRCLAELFVHTVGVSSPFTASNDNLIKNEAYVNTGVPVLVLNAGTNVNRRRELVIVLAQQDTGFVLWQDKVNYMSEYKELQPGIHTMRVSGSTSKSVHLHMFDKVAAAEFLATFRMMTSDPRDELWKMSSKGEGKNQEEERRWSGSRIKPTKHDKKQTAPLKHATEKKLGGGSKGRWGVTSALCKADISRPCDLQLITRVDPTDEHFRYAFADLLPVTILHHEGESKAKEQDATDALLTSETDVKINLT